MYSYPFHWARYLSNSQLSSSCSLYDPAPTILALPIISSCLPSTSLIPSFSWSLCYLCPLYWVQNVTQSGPAKQLLIRNCSAIFKQIEMFYSCSLSIPINKFKYTPARRLAPPPHVISKCLLTLRWLLNTQLCHPSIALSQLILRLLIPSRMLLRNTLLRGPVCYIICLSRWRWFSVSCYSFIIQKSS